ncbi:MULTISPECIES: hypothetical protein [Bacillus cereus group]|uniref:Uncharacterized protein n=1 Tax=Bacillus thuringiensis TaxID=1428 RepID=A0A9X6TGM0_BACTU|nr:MULTISPECIES: hypothetical protein [Bacillus cereus group]PEA85993.1 hypothetical protein CON71_32380 [Bacillus thuringiensis]PGQ95071.1 hypothetical protein COA24_30150 [Bacillus cereus]
MQQVKHIFKYYLFRLCFFIALGILLCILNKFSSEYIFSILLLFHIGFEMIYILIEKGNIYTICGCIFLLISVITYLLGFWDNGNQYISKPFIISIAVASILITIYDFITTSYNEKIIKVARAILLIIGVTFITIILLIQHPTITKKINSLNTDYLAFLSLGTAIATIGFKRNPNNN